MAVKRLKTAQARRKTEKSVKAEFGNPPNVHPCPGNAIALELGDLRPIGVGLDFR